MISLQVFSHQLALKYSESVSAAGLGALVLLVVSLTLTIITLTTLIALIIFILLFIISLVSFLSFHQVPLINSTTFIDVVNLKILQSIEIIIFKEILI